jgi:hypothetical protein
MATINAINPHLNFTLTAGASYPTLSTGWTSKNYTPSNLDFTISVPNNISFQTTNIFNRSIPAAARANVNEPGIAPEQALLGPLVVSGAEVVSDFSANIRQTFSTYHQVYGTESPAALAALGFTTGFNLFSGALNVHTAIKEVRTAEKVNDTAGKTLAQLKLVKGTAQAIGGAVYIPVRALSLAALSTSAKAVSVMAGALGSIGSACFNIVSILAGISIGLKLHDQRLFRKELDAILQDPNLTEQQRPAKALEHLKKLATVSTQEKEEIRRELRAQPENQALSSQQLDAKVEEKSSLLLQKKEAHLKRLIDGESIKQIREKGPAEAKEVIEAVQKASLKKVVLSSIAMALIAIGLVVTAAAFIFTGPIGIIVGAAVSLATSVAWFLYDGYGLIKEFQETAPGRFDKLAILISSIVAVIAVSLVFFLSGGLAPIIAASIVGALWLAINGACYYRLYKQSQAAS